MDHTYYQSAVFPFVFIKIEPHYSLRLFIACMFDNMLFFDPHE